MLRAVGGAEDIADVVGAVYLVEAGERLRAPDVDDGVAGTGEEERGVGAEEQREDAALVRLDTIDLVEGGQGPGDDLSVLCAGEYGIVVGADGEGEDGAAVLEAVDQLGPDIRAVSGLERTHYRRGRRGLSGRDRRHRVLPVSQ